MTPSDVFGARLKQVRRVRDVTAQQLAQRCQQLGVPMTAQAVSNIETGRRDTDGKRRREVTLEEVFAFAYALDTSPLVLFMPVEDSDYDVTPQIVEKASDVGAWIIGPRALPAKPVDPADADFAVPVTDETGAPGLQYFVHKQPGEELARQHRYFAEWPTYLHRLSSLPEIEERSRQLEADANERLRQQEEQLKHLMHQATVQLREIEYAQKPGLREAMENAIAAEEAGDEETDV